MPVSNENPPTPLLRELGRVFAQYVRGKILISLIMWAVYFVAFALLGVPGGWFLSFLCAAFNLIPVFGPAVSIVFTAILTWSARGLYAALGVLAVFAAVQALEGFYLTPRILGRRLNLSPWAIIVGLAIGGALFGFVGVAVAVPAMAIVAVIWKYLAARGQA